MAYIKIINMNIKMTLKYRIFVHAYFINEACKRTNNFY